MSDVGFRIWGQGYYWVQAGVVEFVHGFFAGYLSKRGSRMKDVGSVWGVAEQLFGSSCFMV